WRALGNYDVAIDDFERARKADPAHDAVYLIASAETALQFKRLDDAEDAFREVWKLDPNNDGAARGLIEVLASNPGRAQDLWSFSEEVRRAGRPSVAAEGYRAILGIPGFGKAVDSANVVASWIESLAESRVLSAERLRLDTSYEVALQPVRDLLGSTS